jgi:hypothetical protein
VNNARAYSLECRLAKIERQRGATDADSTCNQLLRRLGEPLCATDNEAFLRILRLMQKPDWGERLRAAGIGADDPADSPVKGACKR